MHFFLVIILPIILVLCIFAPIILLFNLNLKVMKKVLSTTFVERDVLKQALQNYVGLLKSLLSILDSVAVKTYVFERAVTAKVLYLRLFHML